MKKLLTLILVLFSVTGYSQLQKDHFGKYRIDSLYSGLSLRVDTTAFKPVMVDATTGKHFKGYWFPPDSVVYATRLRVQKAIDSLGVLISSGVGTLDQVLGAGNTSDLGFQLLPADPSSGAITDGPEIILTGKGNLGGTVNARHWKLGTDVTTTAGAGALLIQNAINGGGYAWTLRLDNNYNLTLGNTASIDATENNSIAIDGSEVSVSSAYAITRNAHIHASGAAILGGQNTEILGGISSVSTATDTYHRTGADYAFSSGDAHNVWGYASSTHGFGNWNYGEYGFVAGQDNVLGHTTANTSGTANAYQSSSIFGRGNISYTGSYHFLAGLYLQSNGASNITIIGSGVDVSTVPTFQVTGASGAGTYGQTRANGTLYVGSIAQDDAETKLVVWNSTDKVFEWRDVSTISGGGLTDGDKGDITVASGVWGIDASTVALGDIVNIADQTILGNNTGGSAAPVALTAAQTKTVLSLSNVENTALSTWAGTTNITTLGTVGTGTWQGGVISSTYGGTGVNNGGRTLTLTTNNSTIVSSNQANTLTLANNLSTSGNFALTLTQTATTNVTLPTTGTLATLAGSETITNKTFNWANNTVSMTTAQLNTALSDNDIQPLDADLTTIAGLTATTDNFLVSVSSAWASRTPAQVRTTLALVPGTDVQAFDSDLTTLSSSTGTKDNTTYYGGDGTFHPAGRLSAITIESPTASENISLFYTPVAITVTGVMGILLGSSPSVTFVINYGSTRASATGTIVASNTFDFNDTNYNTTGFAHTLNTTSIPAGSFIWITTSAVSGTIDNLALTIQYRQ
jgi:hypothetical protein